MFTSVSYIILTSVQARENFLAVQTTGKLDIAFYKGPEVLPDLSGLVIYLFVVFYPNLQFNFGSLIDLQLPMVKIKIIDMILNELVGPIMIKQYLDAVVSSL